jgi:hypothetical protein
MIPLPFSIFWVKSITTLMDAASAHAHTAKLIVSTFLCICVMIVHRKAE